VRTRIGAAAVLATSLVVIACDSDVVPFPGAVPFTEFHNAEIRFEYPTTWAFAIYPGHRRLRPIAYLSTAPMHDPCVRTLTDTSCRGLPVDSLGPDGVLVMWQWSFPPPVFDPPEGEPVEIGGRHAIAVEELPGGTCSSAGYEAERIIIMDQQTQSYLEMIACLNGPDLRAGRAQVQAMLASVEWAP
jgi:hypothetical protein